MILFQVSLCHSHVPGTKYHLLTTPITPIPVSVTACSFYPPHCHFVRFFRLVKHENQITFPSLRPVTAQHPVCYPGYGSYKFHGQPPVPLPRPGSSYPNPGPFHWRVKVYRSEFITQSVYVSRETLNGCFTVSRTGSLPRKLP